MQGRTVDIFISFCAVFSDWPQWSKLTLLFSGIVLLVTVVLLLLFLLVFPCINKFAGTDFPCRDFASVKRRRAEAEVVEAVTRQEPDEQPSGVPEPVSTQQKQTVDTKPKTTKSTRATARTANDDERVPTVVLPPVQELPDTLPPVTQKSIAQAVAASKTTSDATAQTKSAATATTKAKSVKSTSATKKTTAKTSAPTTAKRSPSSRTTIAPSSKTTAYKKGGRK